MSGGRLPALVSGAGPPVVLLHGFALSPRTYARTAAVLAERARVIVPDLFGGAGPWSYPRALSALVDTLDHLEVERASVISHSFGGGLGLGLGATHPERVVELVFADTLGLSREWLLAREAAHPANLARLAWPPAAVDFARSWAVHPGALARAGWWAFTSDRSPEIAAIRRCRLPAHVLWADRDTLLSRSDGQRFASDLGASFTVVSRPDAGGPVDHDWMYRHPGLFCRELEGLGLVALPARVAAGDL